LIPSELVYCRVNKKLQELRIMAFSKKQLIRTGSHILFWILYYAFVFIEVTFLKDNLNYESAVVSLGLTLPVDILASYFTAYYLLPKLLFTRKYLCFAVSFLLSAFAFILMQRTIMYFTTYPWYYPERLATLEFFKFNYFYSALNIYTIVTFFTAIKLLKYWYQNQNIRMELEKENKNSEIALLRNQINPHFLFNTLNNIDTLIMKDQEQASDAVMKLSEIMRYMLYGSNTEYVPLSKEIDYLKSYISLQKIRFKNPDFAKFEITGNQNNKLIAPMLFIPFVENAFKHGAKTEVQKWFLYI
jgi:two-component system LytT family sensor kinase